MDETGNKILCFKEASFSQNEKNFFYKLKKIGPMFKSKIFSSVGLLEKKLAYRTLESQSFMTNLKNYFIFEC